MWEDRDSERLTDVADEVGAASADDPDDPIGMRVGPGIEVGGYVVDGEIGHGGMGVVYSATHPVIGKRAAIKILRPHVSRSPVAVERFIQEARAVNQIGHPNIVDIFAYGALPDGRAYHVMDLLVGESLRRRLKRGVLHPSEAASVIDETAQALSAAHDHGFIHRDLKPDNVFLVHHEGRWPEVKLLDFGLAKLMPEHGVAAFTTKAGVMLGTPEYMSPEQARGTGVDYRTDIYALGILMFEILAGCRPFPSMGDSLATLMQHAEEPPASIADLVSGLPAEMVQLVMTMLAKTPEARPSLAAVRTVIKRLRSTQLPTRSVAGLDVASMNQLMAKGAPGAPKSTVPSGELAFTASRLGAEPRLPGDSRMPTEARLSPPQPTTANVAALRGTNPSLQPFSPPATSPIAGTLRGSAVGVSPVLPPGMALPAHLVPPRSLPNASVSPTTIPAPGAPPISPALRAPSNPALPAHASQASQPSQPSQPSHASQTSSGQARPWPAASSGPAYPPAESPAGARDPSSPMPRTAIGMGLPVRPGAPVVPPAAPRRRAWLAVAILLVLAAAIALTIALVGT